MPMYALTEPTAPALCKLALDSQGQYCDNEVIKPLPGIVNTPAKKNKPNKNKTKKTKPPCAAGEIMSWRRDSRGSRDSRTNSESSDNTPHRQSDFRPDSPVLRHRIVSSNKTSEKPPGLAEPKQGFKLKTANMFDVIADADHGDENEVIGDEKPKAWFEEFQTNNLTVKLRNGQNES